MQRVDSGTNATLALAFTAALTLLLGVAVYLLDRPAGSAWLIPSAWQAGTPDDWFGAIGPWLPSFVHAFAFSVFTACLLPRRPGFAALACIAWALVDAVAEFGQHPTVSAPIVAGLQWAFDGAPLAVRVGRYFTQGAFDAADLAAGLAGSALAFLALSRFVPHDGLRGPAADNRDPHRPTDTLWGSSP